VLRYKTEICWLSCLIRHPARKRSGSNPGACTGSCHPNNSV